MSTENGTPQHVGVSAARGWQGEAPELPQTLLKVVKLSENCGISDQSVAEPFPSMCHLFTAEWRGKAGCQSSAKPEPGIVLVVPENDDSVIATITQHR